MFIKYSAKFACIGSLIAVIIIARSTFGETTESRGLDIDNERVEKLSSSRLFSNSEEEDDNSIADEKNGVVEEAGHQDGNKTFSWKYHPDDHSIYSHRSLMSNSNIKHHHEEPNGGELPEIAGDDDDDEFEAMRTVDYAEKEWNLMFRAFDSMTDGLTSSMLHQIGEQTNLFEDVVSKLKPDCRRDIIHIKESVQKHKLWALRMVDSNGKLSSGMTYGKFSSPGDYEECLGVSVDEIVSKGVESKLKQEHHKFYGQYCLVDFRLPLPPKPPNKLLGIHDPVLDLSKTDLASSYPEIKNYSAYASVFYEIGYLHAICIPSTCDVKDLTKSLGSALEGMHIIVNNTIDCEIKFEGQEVSWSKAQVISMTLIAVLFLNAAMATLAQHLQPGQQSREHKVNHQGGETGKGDEYNENAETMANESKLKSWVVSKILNNRFYKECFSVQKNFERLTKPDPRGLTFVHYTRIVAMAFTIITHTAAMGTLAAVTKPADASNSEQMFRDFIPQMLANAFSTIQIFFFMAGFMLVVSTYPSIKREKGHLPFPEYAIKRAIRLMPGLAATIALNFLWPLIADGPMLTYFKRTLVEPCVTDWWRTLAFLSNFDHVEKMCIRHSYFSAADYQLHLMAFPLLMLLYKQPVLSLALAALLTITGFVAQVIMVITKVVMPFMMVDYIDKDAFLNNIHYIHHPTWNHMSAFFYGFIVGYLVAKQIRVNLSPKTIKLIWYIIMPAGLASLYAPYYWNHYKRPIYRWQMILYIVIDRFVLLSACAWLSYASLVLGVKKPTARDPVDSKQGNSNLPNMVTLNQTNIQEKSSIVANGEPEESSKKAVESSEVKSSLTEDVAGDAGRLNSRLTAVSSTTSIPRQRSSPNFSALEADSDKGYGLRPAASTIDMGSVAAKAAKDQCASPNNPNPSMVQTQKPKISPPAPVANMNMLCLILSRLTFQLYLFNMVVLWFDVNHSKYNWFFSYYFILTKAFAVYTASSLMAIVFFVTLESPCLSLYIMWVKIRAQARANRRTSRETSGAATSATHTSDSTNVTNIDVNFNPKDGNISNDSLKWAKLGGGLQMRMSSPVGQAKPTFSFIDLSTPPTSVPYSETLSTTNDDQTKM